MKAGLPVEGRASSGRPGPAERTGCLPFKPIRPLNSIFRPVERLQADEGQRGTPPTFPTAPTGKKPGFPGMEKAAAGPAVTNLWKERRAGISPGRATCYG